MGRKKILLFVIIAVILVSTVAAGVFLLSTEETVFYNVTFQDFDGAVLKTEVVETGKAATAPAEPQRDGYTFVGWDKDFSSVVKDTVITAEYLRITETTFMVDTIDITPEEKTAKIKVSVNKNPGILGMMFSVNYDEEVLKLASCQNGAALAALTFQEPSRYINGCNFVWYGSETGEVMDGEMLILTFEITEDAKPGTYPISISWNDRDIYDSNCDMIDPAIVAGGIVVSD